MKNRRGFTLIEMIITVIVMGILVTIALPRYLRVVERSKGVEAREVLLKAYAGYQRRIADGESVSWGSIQTDFWRRLGMSDPMSLPAPPRNFIYDFNNNGGSAKVIAQRIGNASKNMTIYLVNGTMIVKGDYY